MTRIRRQARNSFSCRPHNISSYMNEYRHNHNRNRTNRFHIDDIPETYPN